MRRRPWLSDFQRRVLTAVSTLGGETDSFRIAQKILESMGKRVSLLWINRALSQLREKGCVSCWIPNPLPEGDWWLHTNCRIEAIGERALREPDWNPEPPFLDSFRGQLLLVLVIVTIGILNGRSFHSRILSTVLYSVCAIFLIRSFLKREPERTSRMH